MSWIVRGRAYIVVVRMIFEFPALSTDEKYVHRYCQEIVRLSSIRSACAYVYVCARVCVDKYVGDKFPNAADCD